MQEMINHKCITLRHILHCKKRKGVYSIPENVVYAQANVLFHLAESRKHFFCLTLMIANIQNVVHEQRNMFYKEHVAQIRSDLTKTTFNFIKTLNRHVSHTRVRL